MSARRQQIRSAAAAVRQAYATTRADAVVLPLAVDDLAEQLYLLSTFADPTLDPRIDGELNTLLGTIRLRPGLSPQRRRFITAHELGHRVLESSGTGVWSDDEATLDERAGGDDTTTNGVLQLYNTRERCEQEANLFAIELLIPADLLWTALQQPDWSIDCLAATFGVTPDALLAQLLNVACLEPPHATPPPPPTSTRTAFAPNPHQQRAVDAPLPALVVAGPGTGKTRSIVAKYLQLVDRGVDPANILALTFSNKAAEEMRDRVITAMSGPHAAIAGRVEVATFHAWGLNILTSYGHHLGLPPDVQLRDEADLFVLLKRKLATLPLHEFKLLSAPTLHLGQLMSAIGRAKDELCAPDEYSRLAAEQAEHLLAEAERLYAGKTTKTAQAARDRAVRDAARLHEIAAVYTHYESLLRAEGVLDYGDLVMRAVELLRLPPVAASMQRRYLYILVDEFQDINYASGVLVSLLDGGRGRVWAVGDPWQSIYRFRGASPANLANFAAVYPGAVIVHLDENYRSVQSILDAGHALMAPDPDWANRQPLRATRPGTHSPSVVEWVNPDPASETAHIAHSILRRVLSRRRQPPCARRPRANPRRRLPPSRPSQPRRVDFADHAVLCRNHGQSARVVAALEVHATLVDRAANLSTRPEVQDAPAICALAGSANSAAVLRALTMPDFALTPEDLQPLVQQAHYHKQSLAHAARDPAITTQLSPTGHGRIQLLHTTLAALGGGDDAWQVLTRYLFAHSPATRARLHATAHGDLAARRELASLGQLILVARHFVRQAPPDERHPAALLDYIRTVIEADKRSRTPTLTDGNAVRVMTVHAAKGLEFPIVYVPGLQDGQFPARNRGDALGELPAMLHARPLDSLQEERYLLYVAMTRAQNKLILSRSTTHGEKVVTRSTLLPGHPPTVPAPWPLRNLAPASKCPTAFAASRLTTPPPIRWPLPASSLDTYRSCPRRYLYQYGYQLYDDASPYLRMHQAIRGLVRLLARLATADTLPPNEQALHDLAWSHFATHELREVLYSADYFAETLRHVREYWAALQTGTLAPDAVDHYIMLHRPSGDIAVVVDQVDHQSGAPRWLRTKSGLPTPNDHLSDRIMLYALAHEQAHGTTGAIAIHYSSTGQTVPITVSPGVLANHTTKIDTLVAGIAVAEWPTKPGPQCTTCAFNLICPL
ncbi:MAG: hypothetical protein NVS2B7_25960 [Herpetosiphon sp.]